MPLPESNGSATRVLRQFRVVFNAVKTHFQQVESKAGIGGAQLWALAVVSAHPGIGVSALARAMDIHQSTASNLLRAMVERGLIAAIRQQPDKRSVHLHILPAGQRILRRAPGPFSGVLPDALASLHPEVLDRLESDLGTLIAALGADEHAANVPLADM